MQAVCVCQVHAFRNNQPGRYDAERLELRDPIPQFAQLQLKLMARMRARMKLL